MSMQTHYNVISYKDKPRLRTAVELLKTTEEIEQKLEEVCTQLVSHASKFSSFSCFSKIEEIDVLCFVKYIYVRSVKIFF